VGARSTKVAVTVTLVIILAGFALTQSFVQFHRQAELSLGRRWFDRGEQAMQAHMPGFAAEAYRTALNYNRENEFYRLRLAQALLAENRLPEARAHLLSLWEQEPADGEVNLTLARLAVQQKNYKESIRYYNNAINGVWQSKPREQRTAVRFELADYFTQLHNQSRAQAELLSLLADAPPDPADQLRLGQMLLEVNEPTHALQAYNSLLSKDDKDPQAWLGASEANLALGKYAEAEHASEKAVEIDPKLEAARQQMELTRELLRIDPLARRLSLAERTSRVAKAFQLAMRRLSACAEQKNIPLASSDTTAPAFAADEAAAAPNAVQLLYISGLQKQAGATEQALRKNPDALESTMQYVFEVERTTAPICPGPSVADRALWRLAQQSSETFR
jgi:tetratricopeptide (TPR) repeat protein